MTNNEESIYTTREKQIKFFFRFSILYIQPARLFTEKKNFLTLATSG
jgi:hypothetical protein